MLPDQAKTEQESASLLHAPDSFQKIIITGDRNTSHHNEKGIHIMGIYDFLLHKNSLGL